MTQYQGCHQQPADFKYSQLTEYFVVLLCHCFLLVQCQPEAQDICAMAGQLPVNPGRNFSDNLSCPAWESDITGGPLKCFNRSELCNGIRFCDSGLDEGMSFENSQILRGAPNVDCDGSISGKAYPTFICPFSLESINITYLCDGHTDCRDYRDEMNDLCASTCLPPYHGGCPYNLECIGRNSIPFCGPCINGFVEYKQSTRCISLQGCEELLAPENGQIEYYNRDYESQEESSGDATALLVAHYSCSSSYILNTTESTYERTCPPDGKWSGYEPSCIGCETPDDVANGLFFYSSNDTTREINVTYTCDVGYRLSGDEIRMCDLETGIWSGTNPRCELVDCGVLPHPDHGTVQYDQTTKYDSQAIYSCDDSYVLLGDSNMRTCQSNGEWSGSKPLCELMTVGFERGSYTVSEDIGFVNVCVVLNYDLTFRLPILGITLQLYTSQGTADENDYTKRDRDDASSVINLAENTRVGCMIIFITNDTTYEQDEEFVVNLELFSVIPDSYEVILSSNVTTVTILANDVMFPFGTSKGDTRLFSSSSFPDDAASPPIHLTHPFNFFKEAETILYVNSNGLLSFRESYTTSVITTFEPYDLPSIPLIAPLWTDVNIADGGEIFFRQTNITFEPTSLQHALDLITAAQMSTNVKSSFNPTNFFIATWDHVATRHNIYDNLTYTFQVVLAMDGSDSFIFFIYDQLDQIRDPTNIGFRNSNNSQSFLLLSIAVIPIEDEIRDLRLTETSNVGVPGLYLYQVDESSKLAPKILKVETDKPNHMLQYNVGLNNSFCLEDDQEEVNFTIHCNSQQTLVPQSIEWTYNHGMILDLNQSEISNVLRYRNDQSSLSFGPVSLMDIVRTTSIVNEPLLVISCQLSNDFGQDTASIEISVCAPSVCQDGVTNNCNQLCSRDSNGVHQCACEEGYELGPDDATCELIDCHSPSALANGTVNVTMTTINTVAFYSCDKGFRLSGEDTRVCQDTGLWSGSDPTCEAIHNTATDNTAVIATTVCVAVIFLVIITTAIIMYLIKVYYKKKKAHAEACHERELETVLFERCNSDIMENGNSNRERMELKQSSLRVQGADNIVKDIHHELLIYTANLRIFETIGQGEFGVVYKGHLLKDLGQTVIGVVAIKTLKGFFDQTLVDELLKECLKMQQLSHPNVLSLTGVCLDGGQTPFLVMPFMANGSLVSYLRKERQSLVIPADFNGAIEIKKFVALKRLMDMCFQVAKGMEYLASKRVVHRDLAARNCMIDMNYVIKVADFGLSEQLETKDYFRQDKGESIKLPVKWLALESLKDYVFSEKTDVWSYGVTCWEIFSGGMVPYVSIKPTEMLSKLESGYRMEKPSNAACSDEIYDLVMLQCWKAVPAERPTFSVLVRRLSQSLESMADYLHIGAFEQPQQETASNTTSLMS